MNRTLESVLNVAAPVTIGTGLLVYVGSVHTRAYFDYFGIDQAVLRPSLDVYLLNGVDIAFGIVVQSLSLMLALFVLDVLYRQFVREADSLRWLRWSLLALSAAMVLIGPLYLLGLLGWTGLSGAWVAVVMLTGSCGLLRIGPDLDLTPPDAGRVLAVGIGMVVLVALFWMGDRYARGTGEHAANLVAAHPEQRPTVTVFSERYLDLPGSRTQLRQYVGPDKKPHYRYTGALLLTYDEGTWFLLTGHYSPRHRMSVSLLRNTDDIRVEVAHLK